MKSLKVLYGLLVCTFLSMPAGRQNGKTIFDQIIVINDTNYEIIVDNDICEAGEKFIIQNKNWLKEQTQKLVDIYLPLEKQSLKYEYFTYGLNAGKNFEIFSFIELKVSDLLKAKNIK